MIAATAVLLGDHNFTAMRVIAWSGMLVTYTRDAGLAQGLQQTFDGEHPCCVCRMLDEAQRKDETPTALAAATTGFGNQERVPPPTHVGLVTLGPIVHWRQAADDPRPNSLTDEPPVPPPRHTT